MPIHTNAPDVVIVGGGVIGLAVGWRAAQRGLRATLLERDLPGAGTSAVAAGMIAPIAEAAPREQALLGLALRSARDYPRFVAELHEAAGVDPGYLESGTLFVARDSDEAEALNREQTMREGLGLRVGRLSASQARGLEPALAPSLRAALEFADDRAIDPQRLTAALAEAFRRAGGTLRTGAEVAEVICRGGGAPVVQGVGLTGGELVPAGAVVIAAGPWSARVAGLPTHARIPILPVKGQILRLRDPSGPGLLSRVLRMQPGYVVPRGDGRYLLGASVEERGFDTTVTAGPVFELLRDAIELLPGLGELVIEGLAAGIRPGTPDNKPLLGPGAVPGLHWATGHYRHGILLAPITAEILAGALTGEEPSELARECAPERFGRVAVAR